MNIQKDQYKKVVVFPIIWCGALIGKRGIYAKKINTTFRIGYHVNKNFSKNTADVLFRGKKQNVEAAVSYVTKEVEQWEQYRDEATQQKYQDYQGHQEQHRDPREEKEDPAGCLEPAVPAIATND